MKFILQIFFFHNVCFMCPKKSLFTSRSKRYSPEFSSRCLIVLAFTCKSMIHLKFILIYSVRQRLRLTILHMNTQLFHPHLLKRFSFAQWIPHWLGALMENLLTVFVWVYFWALFCFTDIFNLFFHQGFSVLIIIALWCVLKSGSVNLCTSFSKIVLSMLDSFHFHIGFRICLLFQKF